jgi:hypothetical protein
VDSEFREPEFEGRDELRSQLGLATAKQLLEDGTLKLRCDSGSPASTTHGMVSEGMCKDADGLLISVLLHVDREGFMCMLEILKYHPSPIINPPAARDLRLLDRPKIRGRIREIVYPGEGDQPG